MSSPTISFRVSNQHLARGLQAIRTIDPTWKMTTAANLIRTIFNDFIAKAEQINNLPPTVTTDLLQEIARARSIGNQTVNNNLNQLSQIK